MPPPPRATSLPQATPMPQPSSEPAQQVYELRERCAKDAADWFKRRSAGDGHAAAPAPEYQNHYSSAKNGCFALLTQSTSFKHGAHGKSKDFALQTRTLYDVNENSKLGLYAIKDSGEITACEVLGAACTNEAQWSEMTREYLAE